MATVVCRPDLGEPLPRAITKRTRIIRFRFPCPLVSFHSHCISVQSWMAGLVFASIVGKALPGRQWPLAELGWRLSSRQTGADLECLFNSVSHIPSLWKPQQEQPSQMSWGPLTLLTRGQTGPWDFPLRLKRSPWCSGSHTQRSECAEWQLHLPLFTFDAQRSLETVFKVELN